MICGENLLNDHGLALYDSLIKAMKAFHLPVNQKEIKKTFDNLSKDDWRELYQDEKKAKENCLTKEEYVRNFNEIPNLPSEQAFSDETVN